MVWDVVFRMIGGMVCGFSELGVLGYGFAIREVELEV